MNLIEEMSKYKDILLNEDTNWGYGKGIYGGKKGEKPEVKSVASSTKTPIVNSKESSKELSKVTSNTKEVRNNEKPKQHTLVKKKDRTVRSAGPFSKKGSQEVKESFDDWDVSEDDDVCVTCKHPYEKHDSDGYCKICRDHCYNSDGLKESWDKKMETPESKKGMFKGKTKAELRAELNKAKDRSKTLHKADKPESESLKTKIKELEFALRAKNNFGKVNESKDLLTCKGCGEKCKNTFCTKACRDEYNERTSKKKVVDESSINFKHSPLISKEELNNFIENDPSYAKGYFDLLNEINIYLLNNGERRLAKEIWEVFHK